MAATTKPILFLLRAGFPDPKHGPGGVYCPECATVAGIICYHPQQTAPRDRTDDMSPGW